MDTAASSNLVVLTLNVSAAMANVANIVTIPVKDGYMSLDTTNLHDDSLNRATRRRMEKEERRSNKRKARYAAHIKKIMDMTSCRVIS